MTTTLETTDKAYLRSMVLQRSRAGVPLILLIRQRAMVVVSRDGHTITLRDAEPGDYVS